LRNTDLLRLYSQFACTVLLALVAAALTAGCNGSSREPLPDLGTVDVPYTFTDQDGKPVHQDMLDGTVYVADFFFTTCPSICPIMKSQMLRVYEAFRDDNRLVLLSHTIDPEYDTVDVLHEYAAKLGISAERWHMVTGVKDEIYDTARTYGLAALEDENAPGGFIHSGSFTLIDRQGRIRGYYNGTEQESVDLLIKDIRRLFDEN